MTNPQPRLHWEKVAEITPSTKLKAGKSTRRTMVPGGWLVHGHATLLFIADPSHAWEINWEAMHNCSRNGKARLRESIVPLTYRTPTPSGWLIRSGSGLVELPDPDHEWDGIGWGMPVPQSNTTE